ncbi:MAG: SusD/RagB family nutrient-binding outer membrane lipoprotein [Daejeonella sp.]
MKKFRNKFIGIVTVIVLISSSCEKFYDINKDPDNLLEAPIQQVLTNVTVSVGFIAGSDINRFSSLIMQQYSGQSTGALNQTQQYEQYLITGSDQNNLFANIYATSLNDIELIISKASADGSPHYSGVAKILKAYLYQLSVDAWGSLPYSETQKLLGNTQPKYDTDVFIYQELIKLCDQGIAEVNSATSKLSPGVNSTIFTNADFVVAKNNWIKFANTLKLRVFLHYSEQDPAFATAQMAALISNPATIFMTSNTDSFQMRFINAANAGNPIDQYEVTRPNYLVANNTLVTLMNNANDPRRASYFTTVGGVFKGALGGAAPAAATYSHLHVYLRGPLNGAAYAGTAPIRMLTFAEYNFIRAEAALRFGVVGDAQTFFTAGITASLEDAGVAAADITTYLTTAGMLMGTDAQKLQQIIEQKYIASYGVVMEPWSDWRRTGYPAIIPPANAVTNFIPRSLFYPQSEIDTNPNVKQKADMSVRVFWDTRP